MHNYFVLPKSFLPLIFLPVLLCMFPLVVGANEHDPGFHLYLVRHAEKLPGGSRDPGLDDSGVRRAERLAVWLQERDIGVIWSSDYVRTRDTAKPLLSALGLDLTIYDPRKLPELAELLQQQQQNALVVGHSNTTPDLARLLCDCVIEDMDESEYDHLIVITFVDGNLQVETLAQTSLFMAQDRSDALKK